MNNEKQILSKINKCLREYDLMLIETGGWYDGQSIIEECLALSRIYVNITDNKENLNLLLNTIINEYENFNEWKYSENMIRLLKNFKNELGTLGNKNNE